MAMRTEITLFMFAFGMGSDLLRRVRAYKDSAIMNLSLLYAIVRCQVDRLAMRITSIHYLSIYLLRKWIVYLTFLIFLQVQGEIERKQLMPGLIWEAPLLTEASPVAEVAVLIKAYEAEIGARLTPRLHGKLGIKVNTRSGRGLSTSPALLRAVIEAFEARGFERQSILIIDYSLYGLRDAGILPPLSDSSFDFEGCPVYALDRELYYNEDWFYDSPLPPSLNQGQEFFRLSDDHTSLQEGVKGRKSFLPMPLLFEVDFWVNLAVGVDDNALGIDGALANATLWNVSNSGRFLRSDSTAAVAIAEIAAIPELSEKMLLHFVSLKRYQYIGGPQFNSLYTHSEPRLWMSSDPVAIDRLLFDRINALRRNNGFPEIEPLPRMLPFAASLGLGVFEKPQIHVRPVDVAGTE